MTMKFTRIFSATAALAVLAGAAQADVKVTQTFTVDNPQLKAMMQSMSPEQRAQMAKTGLGGSMLSTVYVSGHKSRTDVGQFNSVIVDSATGKMTTLNRVSHTYSTQSVSSLGARSGNVHASIQATGKSKVIQGHLCKDYRLSMTSQTGGNPVQITGDIWAAPDLPRPAVAGVGGPLAAIQSQWNKVNGMPLQVSMTVNGSGLGATKITSVAKSVSTMPLPASVFAIPAGYQPGPAYSNPMSGGMGR